MLGMLSSVVAAAGRSSGLAPDCPVYRPVQAYGRFVVGRDLHRKCRNGNAVRRPGTSSDARTAVRTARAMSHTTGSPASAARIADPGVADWQASNPDKFGDKLIFAIGTKRRL